MGERGGKGAAVFEYAGSVMAVYRHGFDFSLTRHLDLLTSLFSANEIGRRFFYDINLTQLYLYY